MKIRNDYTTAFTTGHYMSSQFWVFIFSIIPYTPCTPKSGCNAGKINCHPFSIASVGCKTPCIFYCMPFFDFICLIIFILYMYSFANIKCCIIFPGRLYSVGSAKAAEKNNFASDFLQQRETVLPKLPIRIIIFLLKGFLKTPGTLFFCMFTFN